MFLRNMRRRLIRHLIVPKPAIDKCQLLTPVIIGNKELRQYFRKAMLLCQVGRKNGHCSFLGADKG